MLKIEHSKLQRHKTQLNLLKLNFSLRYQTTSITAVK